MIISFLMGILKFSIRIIHFIFSILLFTVFIAISLTIMMGIDNVFISLPLLLLVVYIYLCLMHSINHHFTTGIMEEEYY